MQVWKDIITIGTIMLLSGSVVGFFLSVFLRKKERAFKFMKRSIVGLGIGFLILTTIHSFQNGQSLDSNGLGDKLIPAINIMLKLIAAGIAILIVHDLVLFFVKKKKDIEHSYVYQDMSRILLRWKVTK